MALDSGVASMTAASVLAANTAMARARRPDGNHQVR